jgi:predicted DNA-binding transcriptional regulator AlpA
VSKMNKTTLEQHTDRLININEIAKILGVNRGYISQKLIPHSNFHDIAAPIRLYGNGAAKYKLSDVLKFIDSRKMM